MSRVQTSQGHTRQQVKLAVLAFCPAFLVIVFFCTSRTSDASFSGGTGLGWMEEEVYHTTTTTTLSVN